MIQIQTFLLFMCSMFSWVHALNIVDVVPWNKWQHYMFFVNVVDIVQCVHMDIRICVYAIDHINLVWYSSKFICYDLHFLFLSFIYFSVYSNTWSFFVLFMLFIIIVDFLGHFIKNIMIEYLVLYGWRMMLKSISFTFKESK